MTDDGLSMILAIDVDILNCLFLTENIDNSVVIYIVIMFEIFLLLLTRLTYLAIDSSDLFVSAGHITLYLAKIVRIGPLLAVQSC